jgi:predicted nucleic acid-binding protein
MNALTRVFLDTNIFVYQFDHREPAKQKRAQTLIEHMVSDADGCISTQVVQEFLNVALKKHPETLTPPKLSRVINEILSPLCAHLPSPEFYQRALTLHAIHSLSWYDALIVQAAIDLNCDILYSEDLPDGQRFGALTIKNPFTD